MSRRIFGRARARPRDDKRITIIVRAYIIAYLRMEVLQYAVDPPCARTTRRNGESSVARERVPSTRR